MSAPKTIEIKVSEQQKSILAEISKSRTKAARLVENHFTWFRAGKWQRNKREDWVES